MCDTILSVVIVNWNTRDFLAGCLQSVAADTAAFPQATIETFVVDNGSQDNSAAMVRECFPWVQLIENRENIGFAPANNQAIRLSTGRYILLLNSDTEVRPDAITRMIAFMDDELKAGAAGAHLLNADGTLQSSCQPMLTPWREFWRLTFLDRVWRRSTYDMAQWTDASPRRVEVIKGACMIIRRAALDQIGLLDEQYFMYTEEVDLCYRLINDGWTLHWLPAAQVVHYGEASSRQMPETMYVQLYRSKVQFYRKFGGEPRARLFKRLVTIAYLPRLTVARIMSIVRPALAARTDTVNQLLSELPKM